MNVTRSIHAFTLFSVCLLMCDIEGFSLVRQMPDYPFAIGSVCILSFPCMNNNKEQQLS